MTTTQRALLLYVAVVATAALARAGISLGRVAHLAATQPKPLPQGCTHGFAPARAGSQHALLPVVVCKQIGKTV